MQNKSLFQPIICILVYLISIANCWDSICVFTFNTPRNYPHYMEYIYMLSSYLVVLYLTLSKGIHKAVIVIQDNSQKII